MYNVYIHIYTHIYCVCVCVYACVRACVYIYTCPYIFQLVIPEYGIHILINILFLISSQWLSLLLNMPLIIYHLWQYYHRPIMSKPGLYDPTSIMSAQALKIHQREGWSKLIFYLLSFFYYLYG